jgi:hypothetical protein
MYTNLKRSLTFSCRYSSKKRLPDLEELESIRQNREMYRMFMEHFVASVVGRDRFKKWCHVQELSMFVNASDDAMAVLIYTNNYEVWAEMAVGMAEGETKIKIDDCNGTHRTSRMVRVEDVCGMWRANDTTMTALTK